MEITVIRLVIPTGLHEANHRNELECLTGPNGGVDIKRNSSGSSNQPAETPHPFSGSEPSQVSLLPLGEKLLIIREFRKLFGRPDAIEMWRLLGLPTVERPPRRRKSRLLPELENFNRFLAGSCSLSSRHQVQASVLFRAYCAWASANGLPAVSLVMFGHMVAEAGFAKRASNVIYYLGLQLASKEGGQGR